MSLYRLFAACTLVVLLNACASAPPKGREVEAQVAASLDVNPDRFGVASPITVRVIQLRSDAQFRRAELDALFDNPQTALGGDFVAFEELVLRPGERRPLSLDLRLKRSSLRLLRLSSRGRQLTGKTCGGHQRIPCCRTSCAAEKDYLLW